VLHARIGERVDPGQPLFTVHAASPQCLAAVLDELRRSPLITVDDDPAAAFAEPHDTQLKS
jgi:thymidine phosphorylase